MKQQIIVLAGGTSSRFFPFNKFHKSFFTLGGKRIIEHTLINIRKFSNDLEIIVVLCKDNFEKQEKILKQIPGFDGLKVVCQEKQLGQADGILRAKKFITGDFFVINAQQINSSDVLGKLRKKHSSGKYLATVGSIETTEPWKYGILKFKNGEVGGVEEKPKKGKEPSSTRIVGTYFFSKEFLSELEKTKTSEYSLEETLNKLAGEKKVASVKFEKVMPSLKYPWDILSMKNIILESIKYGIDKSAKVEKSAILKGDVFVGKNSRICDYAVVEGPAYIGDNVIVGTYSQVRGGSILEANSEVQRYVDFKNSVLGENSSIHSGFIGDSVIGENVKIGAGFITANKRIDRGVVKVVVKEEVVSTNIKNLGIIIGNNVSFGIRVSSMPGTIVGSDSMIYPSTTLKGFVDENEVLKK